MAAWGRRSWRTPDPPAGVGSAWARSFGCGRSSASKALPRSSTGESLMRRWFKSKSDHPSPSTSPRQAPVEKEKHEAPTGSGAGHCAAGERPDRSGSAVAGVADLRTSRRGVPPVPLRQIAADGPLAAGGAGAPGHQRRRGTRPAWRRPACFPPPAACLPPRGSGIPLLTSRCSIPLRPP